MATLEFVEKFDHEKGFAKYFQSNILPLLSDIEEKRTIAVKSFYQRLCVSIPIAALAIFFASNFSMDTGLLIFVCVALLVGAGFFSYMPLRSFSAESKSLLIPQILSFCNGLYEHSSGGWLTHDIERSGILPNYDNRHTDDVISGSYNGVSFKAAETKLTDTHRDSEGKSRTKTVFKGWVAEFDLPGNYRSHTVIKHDSGKLINWLSDKFDFKKIKINIDHPEFEKEFEVLSDIEDEARNFLSQELADGLLEIKRTFKCNRSPQLALYKGRAYMAIPNKENMFEIKLFSTALDTEQSRQFLRQMNMLEKTVDTLLANQSILKL